MQVWEASTFGQVAESMEFEMFTGNLVLRDRSGRMFWQNFKYPNIDTVSLEATQMLQYGKSRSKVEGDTKHAEDHTYTKPHNIGINKRSLLDSPCASISACGSYGICKPASNSAKNYECTCPISGNFTFRPLNSSNPSAGCGFPKGEYTAPACNSTTASFMILQTGVDYDKYHDNDINSVGVDQGPSSLTVNDCLMYCRLNCSCQGAFYNILMGQCSHAHTPIRSLRASNFSGHVAFLKIQKLAPACAPTNTHTQSWRSRAKYIVYFIGIPIVVFVSACVSIIWWRMRLKVRKHKIYAAEGRQFHNIINRFSYKELDLATNGFARKLGEGGFGGVYAGQLLDPHGVMIQVAVKKLHPKKDSGVDNTNDDLLDDFMAEVETLGRIDHVNLVRLWGYCVEKPHRLLVYEYMSNGSLYEPLFNPLGSNITLDWDTRQRIAIETARGLNYLHNDCSNKIIHLDIKPANILLDDNLRAKVADFGLSILLDREQGFIEMTQCKGTIGYIAPEIYRIKDSAITEKADVFSYGVVLLELLCGRKNSDCVEDWWLAPYAQQMLKDGNVNEVLDYQLQQSRLSVPQDEVMAMFQVAFWCMQYEPSLRPSMNMVLKWLQGEMPLPVACAPNISPEPLVGNGRIKPEDIWRNNLNVLCSLGVVPTSQSSLRPRIDVGRKKNILAKSLDQVSKVEFQKSADTFSCSLDIGR